MGYLVVDVETTTKNNGHPFTQSNKLCLVGLRGKDYEETFDIEYSAGPFGDHLHRIQHAIDESDILVGFNIKYDLHWLRRYGISLAGVRVHDTQLCFFIQRRQQQRYPSLNEAGEYYGVGSKDADAGTYWDRGVDTCDIPWDVLDGYNRQDLRLTEQVYLRQLRWLEENPKQAKLFELQCRDLLVLEEMEWNGLVYDTEESKKRSAEIGNRINTIVESLNGVVDDVPVNWNSGEHVSAVLYGGVIRQDVREPFYFTYKDPKREGVWKERWVTKEFHCPRLVEPLKNTALAKEGVWQTGVPILRELQVSNEKAKSIIGLLSELADLSKQNDYYEGIPELIEEMEWEGNVLHGNLNQCVAVTGRLSSNKPNLQNMPEDVHECIRSRF